MPVAYNVPSCSIGVAMALKCDTGPQEKFDSYWVKPPPVPSAPPPPRKSHSEAARCHINRPTQSVNRLSNHSSPSDSPPVRRSVSVVLSRKSFGDVSGGCFGARPSSAHLCRMPEYNPFGDPHLIDYFARKYGIVEETVRSPIIRRSSPARKARDYPDGSARSSPAKKKKAQQQKSGKVTYKMTVETGPQSNAGTKANVYVRLKGKEGKMPSFRQLVPKGKTAKNQNFKFTPLSKIAFTLKSKDLGELESLQIEHDGVEKADGWFLKEVVVKNVQTEQKWRFPCDNWLSLHDGDFQTRRRLKPASSVLHSKRTEYEIAVYTADKMGAGTDANVFVTIYGEGGSCTPRLQLKRSGKGTFERGRCDTFRVPSLNVGHTITKIKLEHDNSGFGPAWCVDKVVITNLLVPEVKWFAMCGDVWIDQSKGDKALFKIIPCSTDPTRVQRPSKYVVRVYTGSKRGAGTDANVSINIVGTLGETGERNLDTPGRDDFKSGGEDEFVIEAPSVGEIQRIRIGHDNSGIGPGWFLDKVTVEDVESGRVAEFPCRRWFSKTEDDGKIQRDLYLSDQLAAEAALGGTPYEISVHTGDVRNAGTDARVYVVMHGEKTGSDGKKQEINSGKIFLDGGKFERGKVDLVKVESQPELSPLTRLTVGHDNSGRGPGWYLDKVVVFCPTTGEEQHFVCDKWLADDTGDRLIERELNERVSWRQTRKKKTAWSVEVSTLDEVGAGTDANVFIQLYGEQGKSEEVPLPKLDHSFERGCLDRFNVSMSDVGRPVKLRVWHDNSGRFSGWHLGTVTMTNLVNKEKYTFVCNKWLATDEDFHETCREIPASGPGIKTQPPVVAYKILVYTGKKSNAGTDANVFCTLFGADGDSGMRKIRHSDKHINKFERDTVEECVFECVSLGKLRKVRIEHDNRNPGAGWFLDRVEVVPLDKLDEADATVVFPCNRWLATDEDDGQCVRELYPEGESALDHSTLYNISVKTGSVPNAGTDANVFVHLFGETGDTGKIVLRNSQSAKNKFEASRIDRFSFESANIGQLERLHIGHDGSGMGSGWFLDKVDVEIPTRGETYTFSAHRWLDENELDGKIEIDLFPTEVKEKPAQIPYEICVTTADEENAGSTAKVSLMIYGKEGQKTGPFTLKSREGDFDQGNTARFKVNGSEIGEVYKIRVWHDDSGNSPSWLVDKITIARPAPAKKKKPKKERKSSHATWKDQSPDSPEATRDLARSIRSPSIDGGASMYHRGSILSGSVMGSPRKFQQLPKSPDKPHFPLFYTFRCMKWLSLDDDDGQIIREFLPSGTDGALLSPDSYREYDVKVVTGAIVGASADVRATINIYGSKGDTGARPLRRPHDSSTSFESGHEELFTVHAAVDVGDISKAVVTLEPVSWKSQWFLDRVEIDINPTHKNVLLPCQRWLGLKSEEGQTSLTLVPLSRDVMEARVTSSEPTAIRDWLALELRSLVTTYTLHVFTGEVQHAGTDANVYVVLHGGKDSSERLWLRNSETHKDKFEAGKCDTFTVEAKDLGLLEALTIGHDGAGPGAGWFLETVKVEAPAEGRSYGFPCGRWLDRSEDDGLTERTLQPLDTQTVVFENAVAYEIETVTSDKSGAGTDSDIFVVLYGEDCCTDQTSLEPSKMRRKDRFNKASHDKFILEMANVGDVVKKLRIGHNNLSSGSGWHLDRVVIRKLLGSPQASMTYNFSCGRWLDKGKEDKAIVRELVPSSAFKHWVNSAGKLEEEVVQLAGLELKRYEVRVFTGKQSGSGTDANVFCTIYGENGDTGERKLASSSTHMDKFEKGNEDVFAMEAVDLGKLMKLRIRHDNSGFNAAWYLDKVEVKDDSEHVTTFYCERWLDKNKGDKKIERTLYAKGYEGDRDSATTTKSFGSLASFSSMRSDMKFGSDSSPRKKHIEMPVFDCPTVPYTIKVETGPDKEHGTNANAFITINGSDDKSTGRLPLILLDKSHFKHGSIETFSLQAPDVGELKQIQIEHDGVMKSQGWFIKEVEVDLPHSGKNYLFRCDRWLATDRDDGCISRTISVLDAHSTQYRPKKTFDLTVDTGDEPNAGTDCRITLQIFGANGSTAPIVLEKDEDRFERGNSCTIPLELDDIVPLRKVRITLDPKGPRTTWLLEKMTLRDKSNFDLYTFNYGDWFDPKKSKMKVELPANFQGKDLVERTKYTIEVRTADELMAGTDANVSLILFGENGDSDVLHLKHSSTHMDKFERNHTDLFEFHDLLSLGQLLKLRIWHDNFGLSASWKLHSVEVTDHKTNKKYRFFCNKWLSTTKDDKMISRELLCDNSALADRSGSVEYEVTVRTGDKQNASTRNHAYLQLVGNLGTSDPMYMVNKMSERLFKRGDTNVFKFTSKNVGKLESIRLAHLDRVDGTLALAGDPDKSASWHVYDVTVRNLANQDKFVLLVNQWLDVKASPNDALTVPVSKVEEGLLSTMKTLTNVKYKVEIYTSSEKGAGTDANVYMTLYGSHGDSGQRRLKKSFRDLFERGRMDDFVFELLDLGDLQKIVIGHDNANLKPGWLLDRIEVTNLTTNAVTVFPCNKWLDREKGDGRIERELLPRSVD